MYRYCILFYTLISVQKHTNLILVEKRSSYTSLEHKYVRSPIQVSSNFYVFQKIIKTLQVRYERRVRFFANIFVAYVAKQFNLADDRHRVVCVADEKNKKSSNNPNVVSDVKSLFQLFENFYLFPGVRPHTATNFKKVF